MNLFVLYEVVMEYYQMDPISVDELPNIEDRCNQDRHSGF